MDRHGRDRDNAPGGRPLHTYTPRSHEDLLRSHLQLDASRNARLQNELQRLADENKKLRHELDNAQKDLRDQEDEIDNLKKKLREKPEPSSSPHRSSTADDPNKIFEIDGKPMTLDQIINHFDGVIQKHHDLLDKKNRQIEDLEDALRNRPDQLPKNVRHVDTQLSPKEDNRQDDFAKELALMRKDYEQVENILTDRNNKLENLIEDLRKKLDQYADEIGRLRQELAARSMDPNENTLKLLKEKEKENDYLKDLINSLKNQPQNIMSPGTPNEDLENEIKKIIEDKKNAVKKLSNMIIDLKKTPSGNTVGPPDKNMEKDCKEMMDDLTKMSDKLNNMLQKVKQTPQITHGEPVKKDELLHNLGNLKKQCENEIEALKNQLKSPSEFPDQRRPSIRKEYAPTRPYEQDIYDEPRTYMPSRYDEPVRSRSLDRSPESSLKSYRPVDYRPVTPEESFRHFPVKQRDKPKERLYPEIPSELQSIRPKPRRHSLVSCEACQENYVPHRHSHVPDRHSQVVLPKRVRPTPHHQKPKKKGCCGGKGSVTSNVPYQKAPDRAPYDTTDDVPDEEEIVYIHQPQKSQLRQIKHMKSNHSPEHMPKRPESSSKLKRKLVHRLRPDQ